MTDKELLLETIYEEIRAFGKRCQKASGLAERLELLAKLAIRITKLVYFYWRKQNRPEI